MQKVRTKKSNPHKPPRLLVYGMEGTGKSTFGAKAPKTIFVAPEGGCDQLVGPDNGPVDEIDFTIRDWATLIKAIDQLLTFDHDFHTLCLDSADWIEKLCHKKIIGSTGKSISTVSGGYGAGYRRSESLHLELITKLSKLREERNMTIILTAHAHVKETKDPSMPEDYDCYEIKCHELVSALWREWVDALLFVKFTTFVNNAESGGTKKARAYSDETRTCYTVKQPAFQAKNRYKLPSEMPFTENFWNDFVKAKDGDIKPPTKDELVGLIVDLMKSHITDEDLIKKINLSIEKADKNLSMLREILNRVTDIVNKK